MTRPRMKPRPGNSFIAPIASPVGAVLVTLAVVVPAGASHWNWTVSTLESRHNATTGYYTSLALDAQGRPHIGFVSNDGLRYARRVGGSWVFETVDPDPYAEYASLALDTQGDPHIAYASGLDRKVKHARKVAGTWIIDDVYTTPNLASSCALALDYLDEPHICVGENTTGLLKYALRVSGTWTVETVPGMQSGYASIAVDGFGQPHVSSGGTELRYGVKDESGTWQVEVADAVGSFFGHHSSITLDSQGRPHIGYADQRNLRYARKDGGSWINEVVGDLGTAGVSGLYTSIKLLGDAPRISYYHAYDNSLRYASKSVATWIIDTVDPQAGTFASLALDGNGNPRISYGYGVGVDTELRYAEAQPPARRMMLYSGQTGVWKSTSTVPAAGWNTALTFDESGWTEPLLLGPMGPNPSCSIWHSGEPCGTAPQYSWFRAKFTLTAPPSSAVLDVAVDDDVDVYINGQLVLANHDCFASILPTVDVTSALVVGENLVAVLGDDCAGFCRGLTLAIKGNPPPAWLAGGTPLGFTSGAQREPVSVEDGAGGAIVAWLDERNGRDIYVQRVSGLGEPLWDANGVGVCTDPGAQDTPRLAGDGAGGAIVVWQDSRSGGIDLYAQRVNAAGSIMWTDQGVAVTTAGGDQQLSAAPVVEDGAGGVIIAWHDLRSGDPDIYVQRLDGTGMAQWTAGGIDLTPLPTVQAGPVLAADGAGGAIAAWQDFRAVPGSEIYAQRVDGAGMPLWTANGVRVSSGPSDPPGIVSAGAGGAIVAWPGSAMGPELDIYAQRLSATGQGLWVQDGVVLCNAPLDQGAVVLTEDGASGAIIGWVDARSGRQDIYAQRVDGSGTALWTGNGVPVCTEPSGHVDLVAVSDLAGGAIFAWADGRATVTDIYAQRVLASGAPAWMQDGIAVAAGADGQGPATAVSDGAGGAIVAWEDARCSEADIFAARISTGGGVLTGVGPAPASGSISIATWPNPFATRLQVHFSLPASAPVELAVFDVLGRRVHAMPATDFPAGPHTLVWDGRGERGDPEGAGVYFVRVRWPGVQATRRVVKY